MAVVMTVCMMTAHQVEQDEDGEEVMGTAVEGMAKVRSAGWWPADHNMNQPWANSCCGV